MNVFGNRGKWREQKRRVRRERRCCRRWHTLGPEYEKERPCTGQQCRRGFRAEKDRPGGGPGRRDPGTAAELSEGPAYGPGVPREPR